MSCPGRAELLDVIHGVSDAAAPHIRECAACRKAYSAMMAATEALSRVGPDRPSGPCLTDEQLIRYGTRDIHPDLASQLEEHLASCAKCLEEVALIAEVREVELPEPPAELRARVLGGPRKSESGLLPRIATRRPTVRVRPPRRPAYGWVLAAAAVVLLAAVFLVIRGRERGEVKPEPPRSAGAPKREEPREEKKEEERRDEPRRVEPKREEKKEERITQDPRREEPKKEEPKREEPRKEEVVKKEEKPPQDTTRVEETKYRTVQIADIRGELHVRNERAAGRAEVARRDEVATGPRWKAAFSMGSDARVWMREGTLLRMEQTEAGDVAVTIERGEAYFEVRKRTAAFVVKGPHADAIVVGTVFTVRAKKTDTTLLVVEGQVRFKNAKGEVTVEKDQKSVATTASRPSTPVRTDVGAEVAWTTRGDIAKEPPRDPYIEFVAGTNPKLPGLVIVSPYSEWEVDSGRIARASSDVLECGLVLGHFHRDKKDRKIWLNIDRGTEGRVADDGSVGTAESTKRAREVYEEYLRNVRSAAGVHRQVPMIVHFRDHSEVVPGTGEELAVCEVAWTGFDRRTIKALKQLHEDLVKEHKPPYVLTLRFDELDEQYEFSNQKIKFKFTEGDAKSSGYMAAHVSKKSIAFFFNPSFGNRFEDFSVYAKIFAKMIEFLFRS